MTSLFTRAEARPTRRSTDRPVKVSAASSSRFWLPGAIAGLSVVVLLFLVPDDTPGWGIAYLAAFMLSLVIMLGSAINAPYRVRVIWWLLLIFQALTMAAQATARWQEKSGPIDFPGISDAVFLLAYVPAFAALGILIHRLRPGNDRQAWIDAAILTVTASCVFVLFLIAPLFSDPQFTGIQRTIALAYPVLDLALLSVLMWLLVGTGRPSLSLALLTVSFTLTLAADIVRDASLIGTGGDLQSSWTAVVRLAALVVMACAATTTSAYDIATPEVGTYGAVTSSRLSLLAIGVLTVPSLVAVRLWNNDDTATLLLALGAIIVIILAIWRLEILVTAVERQRRVTELVLNSTGEGIIGMDRDGMVLFANLSARRMLRSRETDLVGRRFHDLAHHERSDGTSFPFDECPINLMIASGGEGVIHDQVFIRRDGTHFPVEIVVSPLILEGNSVGAVQSFRDISERMAMDEIKRQFVSVVSHELRTPLTSIKGSLQMLDSGMMGDLNGDQQELLSMAVSNSERLGQLVNDILDIERLDAGKMPLTPEDVSATTLIEQAAMGIRGAADAAGIRIQISAPARPSEVLVHVDPHRMLQVLTNLLGNAIKFSERGASVQLRTARVDDEVTIAVVDRGRGIPEDQIATVFDRFGQVEAGDARRDSGTGLGLAISKEIVVRSGGRIEVSTVLGKGSTFTVHLPSVHHASLR